MTLALERSRKGGRVVADRVEAFASPDIAAITVGVVRKERAQIEIGTQDIAARKVERHELERMRRIDDARRLAAQHRPCAVEHDPGIGKIEATIGRGGVGIGIRDAGSGRARGLPRAPDIPIGARSRGQSEQVADKPAAFGRGDNRTARVDIGQAAGAEPSDEPAPCARRRYVTRGVGI